MLLKQSLAVDTTLLKDGLAPIAKDLVKLKEYLRVNPHSLYCTPQLINEEEPKAIIVLRMKQKKKQVLMTMINPMILNIRDTIAVEETQDQVEGTYLNIRHPQLHIAYLSLPGAKPAEVTLSGKSALIFQQALRLTQGISIDTFGLRIDNYPEYQNGTDEEKQQIIQDYVHALRDISEEAQKDEDTSEYIKATEFMAQNAEHSVQEEFKSNLQDAYEEVKAATEQVEAKHRETTESES